MTKQNSTGQHYLLHMHYPNDCCLCKAEKKFADLKMSMPTKVFVVTIQSMSGDEICGIYKNYSEALLKWNNIRLALLKDYEKGTERNKKLYDKMVIAMKCEDPNLIDNLPHFTPIITEYDLS